MKSLRKSRSGERGGALVEFSIVIPFLLALLFGATSIGIMMGRYVQACQLARDVAHMYADGVDFSVAANQNIVVSQLAAGTGMTATGGNGVVILSQVRTIYDVDCIAAAISPCTNQGLPVFTQRIAFGNPALRASSFGTPGSTNTRGNIDPTVYLSNSDTSVRTNGFEAFLDSAVNRALGAPPTPPAQPQGDTAYVAEVFFTYPDLGFLGWYSGGGVYVSFVYH
jgi:TadE-like protein